MAFFLCSGVFVIILNPAAPFGRLAPKERAVAFLAREPFPSVATGAGLPQGKIATGAFAVASA
jgi:hypothetical protein